MAVDGNRIGSLIRTLDTMMPGFVRAPMESLVLAFGRATETREVESNQTSNALGAMIAAVAILASTYFGCKAVITRVAPRVFSSELLKAVEWSHIAAMCWIVHRALDSIYGITSKDQCRRTTEG